MPSGCSCCDGVCSCAACVSGKASCCYEIQETSTGDSTVVFWDGECTWTNRHDYPAGSITITETTLTVTFKGEEYSISMSGLSDCRYFVDLAVEDVTISAIETNLCGKCECFCAQCSSIANGLNASCCYMAYISPSTYYLLVRDSEADGYNSCVWSGEICDTGETVTLTISGGTATLQIGPLVTYSSYPPGIEGFSCCGNILVYSDPGEPGSDFIEIWPLTGATCSSKMYECAQLTLSGIVATCNCSACNVLNGTFSLTWDGASYIGTLCKNTTAAKYDKCSFHLDGRGWNYASVAMSPTGRGLTATATIWSRTTIAGETEDVGRVVWQGSFYPEDVADEYAEYELPFKTQDAIYGIDKCDFSNSVATVSVGPRCTPCGDSINCTPDCVPLGGCKECAYPVYYEVRVPNGYIGSWGPGQEVTYLLAGTVDPITGPKGSLTTGNTTCLGLAHKVSLTSLVPTIILIEHGPPPGYSARYTWGATCANILALGDCPADTCSGAGSVDCFLYGEELTVPNVTKIKNTCPSGNWDGSPVYLRAF